MVDVKVDYRLEKTTEKNKIFYKDWIEYITNVEELGSRTVNAYRGTILQIFEYSNYDEVTNIDFDTITEFLFESKAMSTFNAKHSHIKSFFVFVNQKANLSFDINELDTKKFTNTEIKENAKRKPVPLSIDEIIQIRNSLMRNQEYDRLLTFELTYQYGLKLEEISECHRKNYDPASRTFTINKTKKQIRLTDDLHYLTTLKEDVIPPKKYRFSAFQYRIEKISDVIDRDSKLKWQDISETRKKFLFTCPRCGEAFESVPQNWVIFEYNIDKSKWIVCKSCGEKR
jgi:hypothetical protein